MYNMLHGVNPATFIILPMLGKHPDEYPRFRDCFLKDKERPEYDNHIHVYTRVGGNNRNCGFGEEELESHPNFVTTFDDSFDSTYATYVFSIPDEWKEDYNKITSGDYEGVSKTYLNQMCKVFPKLEDKFREMFSKTKEL